MVDISSGENKITPPESVGSAEFYHGEKQLEEVDIPALRNGVKSEMVTKEEIYKDKIEKHAEFIASLGRKKTEEESLGNSQPDYVEQKISRGKKIFFAILILVILGTIAGGGYFWWLKKPAANLIGKKENAVVIPVNPETATEEKKNEENQSVAEVAPADLSIKVLNAGALAGSAGKTKTTLVGKGYAKVEAGNGQGENVVGSTVYYKSEQFKKSAEAIKKILTTAKIIFTVKEALVAEQQSADIVVILGK